MRFADLLEILEWRDAIDLAVLALLAYGLLKLVRGTRAVQVIMGILGIVATTYIAELLNLEGLSLLLQAILVFLPFAIVVLFQQQIRRGLASIGRNPLFGIASQEATETGFNELVLAADTLAKRQIGALIVIERAEGLRDWVENGIQLDSLISFDLLLSIFNPASPLHDGAVIIQGDRVAAAACFLPLTSNPELSTRSGTRHRAALGISEETDCLAIVVSEETGMISVALAGHLEQDLDARSLRNELYRQVVSAEASKGAAA